MIELRDYQRRIVDEIGRSRESTLVGLACGLGKTELSLGLVQSEPEGHALFVVDRKTLVKQTVARAARYGILADVLQGDNTLIRSSRAAKLTVASAQTLAARMGKPDVERVLERTTRVIVDEAHIRHRVHKTLSERFPNRLVGLSGTPLSEGLGSLYPKLLRGPSYEDAFQRGLLVRPDYFVADRDALRAALRQLKARSTGDWGESDLSALMRTKTLLADTVSQWQALGQDRQTIVFSVDLAHSGALLDEFREAGIAAEAISCHTSDPDREAMLKRFDGGETRILISVGVLAVGYDSPVASCAILDRPTLSVMLHIQQMARIVRLFKGKTDARIIDCAANLHRHPILEEFGMEDWPPEAGTVKKKRPREEKPRKGCPGCGALSSISEGHCRLCGFEVKPPSAVTNLHVNLTRRGASPSATPEAAGEAGTARRDFYLGLLYHARMKGYSDGWAYHAYVRRFGLNPPWGWKSLVPTPDPGAQRFVENERRQYKQQMKRQAR